MAGKVAIAPPAHKRPILPRPILQPRMRFSKRLEAPVAKKPPAHKRVPHVRKLLKLTPEEIEDNDITNAAQAFTDMSFMTSLTRAGLLEPGPADVDDVPADVDDV